MKLSSAVPEIIDVLQHNRRELARLLIVGRVSVLFNLVFPEPKTAYPGKYATFFKSCLFL